MYATDSSVTGAVIPDDGVVTGASTGTSADGSTPFATAETTPTDAQLAYYHALDCAREAARGPVSHTDPNAFIALCGKPDAETSWHRYLLGPAVVQDRQLASAEAQRDTNDDTGWDVVVTFKPSGANAWATYTAGHVGSATALVVDGRVFSVETIVSAITGPMQITGNFNEKQAEALAAAIRGE